MDWWELARFCTSLKPHPARNNDAGTFEGVFVKHDQTLGLDSMKKIYDKILTPRSRSCIGNA